MTSTLAKKAAGTFVEDTAPPRVPLLAWMRQQVRHGSLHEALVRFCAERPEPLEAALAQVDQVDEATVRGHIPYRLSDHEAPGTFLTELFFEIDLAREAVREVPPHPSRGVRG